MSGKLIAGFIVVLSILFGAGLYYSQVYAYYEPVAATAPQADIRATTFAGVTEESGIGLDESRRAGADRSRAPNGLSVGIRIQ